MWNDAQPDVQPFLQGGESLLWSGRPRPGIRLQPADAVMIPISMMWGGFVFFWEYTVIRSRAPVIFMLWGVPFVLVGLNMIIGRFFFDAARRAKTLYAVTSERVMIITGGGKTVASYPLTQIPNVTSNEGSDGFGTVTLNATSPALARFTPLIAAASAGAARSAFPALEMIENPKLVAETITRAQRDAAGRAKS